MTEIVKPNLVAVLKDHNSTVAGVKADKKAAVSTGRATLSSTVNGLYAVAATEWSAAADVNAEANTAADAKVSTAADAVEAAKAALKAAEAALKTTKKEAKNDRAEAFDAFTSTVRTIYSGVDAQVAEAGSQFKATKSEQRAAVAAARSTRNAAAAEELVAHVAHPVHAVVNSAVKTGAGVAAVHNVAKTAFNEGKANSAGAPLPAVLAKRVAPTNEGPSNF